MARADVETQLTILRLGAVALFLTGILLDIDGTGEVIAIARATGAVVALGVGAIALGLLARGRVAAWSWATLATAAVLAGAALAGLGVGDGVAWPLAGAITVGLGVAARVAIELEMRGAGVPADDGADAYLAHLRARRAAGVGGALPGRAATRRVLEDSRLAPIGLIMVGAGLVGMCALYVAAEADAPAAILLPILLLTVPLLGVGLAIGAVLATLPIGLFLRAEPGAGAPRGLARASGVQPLPDIVASAFVSLAVQLSAPWRRGR